MKNLPRNALMMVLLSLIVVTGMLIVAAFTTALRAQLPQTPTNIAQSYFLANYVQDYATAWDFISDGDQAFRTREQFLAENAIPTELETRLLRQMANWGEFSVFSIVSTQQDQTVVWVNISYPDRTQSQVTAILETARLPSVDEQALRSQLQELNDTGQLQFTEEEIGFNLTQDADGWRVVLHWDGTIVVHLLSAVNPDLPWEFYPLEPELQVMPGETVQTAYFVRNNSDQTITGKAVHEILPLEYRSYFQTIQCFCFTEQTLQPGEEREMPLIFRIDFTVPQGVQEFSNGYTFYTLDSFPEAPSLPTPTP